MKNNFLELLESFLSVYIIQIKGLSSNTARSYKYTFKLLFKYLYEVKNIQPDKVNFNTLDYDTIVDFLDWIESERSCSSKTRNQRLAAINSFSKYAAIHSIDAATSLRKNILNVPLKKVSISTRTYFNKDEVKILFEQPNINTKIGERDRTILTLMYATGIRAQELCDLKIKDIHFENDKAKIAIHGKGGKIRIISITKTPSTILKKYIDKYLIAKTNDDYVFSSQTHNHMTISCVEEIYKKYIISSKKKYPNLFLNKYSPHSMRHTTATHMVEAGIPLLIIKNFLGHSSIETTQIYASVTQNVLDNTLTEWNEKWISDLGKKINSNIPSFLE